MERLADGFTVVEAEAELFPSTGSFSFADTDAVLLMLPVVVVVTTMVTVADAPLASAPNEQLTVAVPAHEP